MRAVLSILVGAQATVKNFKISHLTPYVIISKIADIFKINFIYFPILLIEVYTESSMIFHFHCSYAIPFKHFKAVDG